MLVALIIGGVILIAMTCLSLHAAVTLPAGALVPIHFGIGYNNFVPKRYGLIMYPAGAAVAYCFIAFVSHHAAQDGGNNTPAIIVPVIMGVLLVTQVGAIRVAGRRSGTGQQP